MNIANSSLLKLLNSLKHQYKKIDTMIFNYTLPGLFDIHNYQGSEKITTKSKDIIVNPYHFFISLIENEILPRKQKFKNYSTSLATTENENNQGDWVKRSFAYSMMVRTSSCYDHDRSDTIDDANLYGLKETGTFVKSLALLPHLKRMGINLIYMLPISANTKKYKKGEMGSPYGVKDFYQLDEDLFDPITGDLMTINEQFKAFVEAAHIYGMRIALDYIPRTNARDSNLIINHPDWFYWIKKTDEKSYKTPYVENIAPLTIPNPEHTEAIYSSYEVIEFIKLFKMNPKQANPDKWKLLLARIEENPAINHLELIEQMFGLTIAPAFADVMNDPQPAWNDVTFFRMYLDHPIAAKKFVKSKIPYMLFDVAKSSLNPGNIPNQELWELLSNVIPYYQKEFGIDAMRIDMGHALPEQLTLMIIEHARKIDPNFCFIAEELQPQRALHAKKLGYNMIIGNSFFLEPRIQEFKLHEFFYSAKNIPCPVFAACETHDTKRIAARDGGRILAKLISALNLFIPNAIPFLNSGQEVYELQPMNLGLDCLPQDLYSLDENDPLYAKLALFDRYSFHYNTHSHQEIPDMLYELSQIRNSNIDLFTNPDNAFYLGFEHMRIPALGIAYFDSVNQKYFIIIAHSDLKNNNTIICQTSLLNLRTTQYRILYSTENHLNRPLQFNEKNELILDMMPGELIIIN